MWSFQIICSFFYLLQQLYFESLGIIKPSSLIIISAKEINSGEQGNSTFCKPHNLVPRVLSFPSLGAREGTGRRSTLGTRLQATHLLNEFHIILQFVTAVTSGSFLGKPTSNKIIRRLYPSIQPWKQNPNGFSLSYPSSYLSRELVPHQLNYLTKTGD